MSLQLAKLQKPLRKLRKSLNNPPSRLFPELVHDLRTGMRRVESVFHALMLDSRPNEQKLLRSLRPVRREAGKVRNSDVLTGFASTLNPGGDRESLIQLIEHLGAQRYRQARKLRKVVRRNGPALAARLKRSTRYVEKVLDRTGKQPEKQNEWPADAMSVTTQLSGEVGRWPRLNASNLHAFRLKVKELRYVLQLADKPDTGFIDSLGEVKDAIGEWHDWQELAGIAEKVLDRGAGGTLINSIRSTAKEKFDHALIIANRMRQRYLTQEKGQRGSGQRVVTMPVKLPAVAAASSLAS